MQFFYNFRNLFIILLMSSFLVSCLQKDGNSSSSSKGNFTLEGESGGA